MEGSGAKEICDFVKTVWENLFSGQAVGELNGFPRGGGQNSSLLRRVDGSAIEYV